MRTSNPSPHHVTRAVALPPSTARVGAASVALDASPSRLRGSLVVTATIRLDGQREPVVGDLLVHDRRARGEGLVLAAIGCHDPEIGDLLARLDSDERAALKRALGDATERLAYLLDPPRSRG